MYKIRKELFSMFFIDARTDISFAESRLRFERGEATPYATRTGGTPFCLLFFGADRTGVWFSIEEPVSIPTMGEPTGG